MAWLQPLPIRFRNGTYVLPGTEEPFATFEEVVNAQQRPGRRLPRRINEIRRALANTLRYSHNPALQGRGPWIPDDNDPAFRVYRSYLIPLLQHQLWQNVNVIAAPFLLNLTRRPVAGAVDVIYQLQDGTIAVGVLHCERPESPAQEAILTELGGYIAAICDHLLLWPSHAVVIYCAPDETLFEYHHPDVCLGRWVDAIDHARTVQRLQGAAA